MKFPMICIKASGRKSRIEIWLQFKTHKTRSYRAVGYMPIRFAAYPISHLLYVFLLHTPLNPPLIPLGTDAMGVNSLYT